MIQKLEWKRLDLNPPKWKESDAYALLSDELFVKFPNSEYICIGVIFHAWESGIKLCFSNWSSNDEIELCDPKVEIDATDIFWCEIPEEVKALYKTEPEE